MCTYQMTGKHNEHPKQIRGLTLSFNVSNDLTLTQYQELNNDAELLSLIHSTALQKAFIRPPDIVVGGLIFYQGFFFLLSFFFFAL